MTGYPKSSQFYVLAMFCIVEEGGLGSCLTEVQRIQNPLVEQNDGRRQTDPCSTIGSKVSSGFYLFAKAIARGDRGFDVRNVDCCVNVDLGRLRLVGVRVDGRQNWAIRSCDLGGGSFLLFETHLVD